MASIKFKTNAKITGIKARLEGSKSEDTQVRGLDLSMTATIAGGVLAALLGIEINEAAKFWTKSSDGRIPAHPGLGQCKSKLHFENCNITIGKKNYHAADARGFKFTIADEHVVEAAFVIRLFDLSDTAVGGLWKLYQESVPIDLESAQMDIDDE